MLKKLILVSVVSGAFGLLTSTDALGHGGTYRGPGDSVGGGGGSGPGTGGGGGGPTTGGGGSGPSTPGSNGPSTGGPGAAGAGGGAGKGPVSGGGLGKKKNSGGEGFDAWQFWWEYNKDRFINVRARLADNTTTSGSGSLFGGQGKTDKATNSTRPDADEVQNNIVPLLKSVLGESDADIVDSAVLSLGRIVNKDLASTCLDDLKTALRSTHNSVRQSTLLAFGVLGSKDAIPVLVETLNDTAEGRKLQGATQKIQDIERAFAAVALGYIGSVDTIPVLKDAITKNSNTEKDIRAMSVLALGMFKEGKEDIIPFLTELLKDEKMDENIAGQIPIALSRLGADSAIPMLQKLADGRKTLERVEESTVIALGLLTPASNKEVVSLLRDKIKDSERPQVRHFAIIALAEIAARATAGPDDNSEVISGITKFLLSEMTDAKKKPHEPWAGLGLALIGSKLEAGSRQWGDIAQKIQEKFEKEPNPSFKSAYAIGLGILNATVAGDIIQKEMLDSHEFNLQGYCAVALGMLRHADAKESLRKLVLDDKDPKLRLQIATALGLMGDIEASGLLLTALGKASTLTVISSLARAVGLIGDKSAVPELQKIVSNKTASALARGFGCVALGLLAEKTDLPWNAGISIGINYRTQVPSLGEVLDIL